MWATTSFLSKEMGVCAASQCLQSSEFAFWYAGRALLGTGIYYSVRHLFFVPKKNTE